MFQSGLVSRAKMTMSGSRREQAVIDRALAGILNNIQFREYTENKEYIHALLPSSLPKQD